MKNKRGISIMIGYVLLIVFALIMGTIVYNVVKTYVPKNVPECPEDVSIFITDLNYTEDFQLNITITNNGLFNIAGYFIRATNSLSQEIATKDLSEFLLQDANAKELNNVVIFLGENSPMKPNDKQTQIFNLDEEIYSIELIPVRFQEENNNNKFVSCGGSKIREKVFLACTPVCGTMECGPDPICGKSCGTCTGEGETCTDGVCVPPEITESIVFVSSESIYTGNFGNISGADSICNELASTASLSGTFIAWLSNSTTDAKDRIIITDIPFKLVDNTLIANDKADLIDGSIDYQINMDENGQTGIDAEVWTGTNEFGLKIIDGHCNNWVSASYGVKGKKGKSKEKSQKWTNERDKGCDNLRRIYCFQVS